MRSGVKFQDCVGSFYAGLRGAHSALKPEFDRRIMF